MKNRIAFLVVSTGVSLGAAAVMLAGGSAQAAECVEPTTRPVCEFVEDPPCLVAVGTHCDECVIAVAGSCGADPTPTLVPKVS